MEDFKKNGYIVNTSDDTSNLLSMPSCYQNCDEWCWATVVTMIIDHYKGESTCTGTECKVAGHEFGHECCPYKSHACHHSKTDKPSQCNHGGTDSEMADAAKHFTGKEFTTSGPLSQKHLDEILAVSPVMVAVSWGPGRGGHALILASHHKKGHYKLHDPWGWYENKPPSWKSLSYDGVLTYHAPDGGSGKWVGSIYHHSRRRRRHSKSKSTVVV